MDPCSQPGLAGQPADVDLEPQRIDRRTRKKPPQSGPYQLLEVRKALRGEELVVGLGAVELRLRGIGPFDAQGGHPRFQDLRYRAPPNRQPALRAGWFRRSRDHECGSGAPIRDSKTENVHAWLRPRFWLPGHGWVGRSRVTTPVQCPDR